MTQTSDNLPVGRDEGHQDAQVLPRVRKDLEITEQVYYGKPCYVLKDPTTLRYFRLRPPEHMIFAMLDGGHTMDDVLRGLAERFPQDEYDRGAVLNFLVMLRSASLLEASGAEASDFLLKRKAQQQQGFLKKLRREFLFFRIPLIDPDKLLNWMERRVSPLIFNRFTQVAVVAFVLGALLLVAANVDKFGQRQPLLSWMNMLYLLPALLVIKVVHEFGHGLTSKHFGCEVHEMGILFLVFMPCAYCDVSDAWMISEKRKRMWITAAGIAVEVVLAAVAGYIWVLTQPKTVINQFALNAMIAASLNTLLFNGNPLLRYDGYYFLMDLMEIPNLKQKGSGYLSYLLQRYVLGAEDARKPLDVDGREPGVLGYAVLSAVYRWFIMFAIVAMVWTFLDPYGWGVIGAMMAIGCLFNALIAPVGKGLRYLVTRWERLHIRAVTAGLLLVVVAGAAYGVLAIPIEQSVEAQCVLRPARLRPVYVTRPGFVQADESGGFVRDGQAVRQGEVLLRLSDPELEAELADLELQLQQLDMELARARQMAGARASGGERAEEVRLVREGVQAQLERGRVNQARLVLRAPIDGVLQLRTGEPLEKLGGSFLPVGTVVLSVYEPGRYEAVAAVGHRDIGLVKEGQEAQIRLWSMSDRTLTSQVESKPGEAVRELSSPAFSAAYRGEVAVRGTGGREEALQPAAVTYELELAVEDEGGVLRDGMVGRAKVIVERKTLGWTAYVWLLQTLRQDLRLL